MLVALLTLLVATAPAPESKCHAVINLADGVHLSVTIDGAPTIASGLGWIAHDGARSWSVFRVTHEQHKKSPHGTLAVTWDELFAQQLPDGIPVRLAGDDPGLEAPQSDDAGNDWQLSEDASVVSIIGPFVSVTLGAYGFTGGAHERDEPAAGIFDLRGNEGRQSLLAIIGARAAKPFAAAVAEAAKAYRDDGGQGAEPSFDEATHATLVFEGDTLTAQATLDCCMWVENHNQVPVSAELVAMPAPLTAYGTLKVGRPLHFVAPDQCGSLAIDSGGVIVVPKSGVTTTLPYPNGKPSKLIGVTWLRAPPVVELRDAKRTWSDPSDDLAAAIKATKDKDYTTAVARFHDVLAVEPLNTKAAAGLGYALLLAKDYRASVTASRLALGCDPDDAQRGAIGYNLGMALEALGDKAGARKAFTDSLAARPNATVQKRLDALD